MSWDEKGIQIWDALDAKQMTQALFFEVAKSHKITCICFARKYEVIYYIYIYI